jgi:two-component system response regulator YesN
MLRLLIVDDEWLIRKGIVGMVQRLSSEWQVEEAANGKEAMDRIAQSSFDLILCDIKMPGMDGIEMLDALTRLGCRVPVVFLTGYDEFTLVRNALRLRAYDYLLKPIHDEDMTAIFSKFKKDFMPMRRLPHAQYADLQKFEFRLLSALETFDPDQVSRALDEGEIWLADRLTKAEYVDEVLRIANCFFGKYRMYGFDKDLALSTNDVSNLEHIRHAIAVRLAYLKEREGAEKNNKIIQMAKAYIESHIDRQLTLAEVAGHVHFNPTYFSEYFKEKCGETFIQYVTRVKIEKAKTMLQDPTLKITDVSEYLGYKDPRSFTKMFKMLTGITPTEYRNVKT